MNPETREHVLFQQFDGHSVFHCGCYYRTDHTIALCRFHEGYDEGIDLLRPDDDRRARDEAIIRQTWKLARPSTPRREQAVIDRIIAAAEEPTP